MSKETFDFSEALKRMRKGKLVKRENGLYPFGIKTIYSRPLHQRLPQR